MSQPRSHLVRQRLAKQEGRRGKIDPVWANRTRLVRAYDSLFNRYKTGWAKGSPQPRRVRSLSIKAA